jgi:hypothetical protein
MKEQEYKDKLAQVAEVTLPEVAGSGHIKRPKRGRKSNEEVYQEEHEQVFLDLFDGKNPTLQPQLVNVKIQGCMCEDCGRFCEQGRRTEKKLFQTNHPHWRERCLTCGMNQNPNTGQFDLPNKSAAAVWAGWLRDNSEKPYAYKKTIRIAIEEKQDD